jgi:hypothetical protein
MSDNNGGAAKVCDMPEANDQAAPEDSKTYTQVVEVECEKCKRKFNIDFYPFAPSPFVVKSGGASLAPYLREILEGARGPIPELIPRKFPTHVPNCSECVVVKRNREGDTFKKKQYRGKFKTFGRVKYTGKGAEIEPDGTYDKVDQKLTEAHLRSRYGKAVDHANEQSRVTEALHKPEKIIEAQEVLDGLSLREIDEQWGIPRMTASRGKKGIRLLAQREPKGDV